MQPDYMKAVMNPVRQRMLQYLQVHGEGTVRDMAQVLTDVSQASLYRHMGILLQAGVIEVAAETPVRGTVERRYAPARAVMSGDCQQVSAAIQSMLIKLSADFAAYFQQPEVDPVKDMLTVATSTLLLTQEEYEQLLRRISQVLHEALNHAPAPGRRVRHLTLISSPEGKGDVSV